MISGTGFVVVDGLLVEHLLVKVQVGIVELGELSVLLHKLKQLVQFWLQHLGQKGVVFVVQTRLQSWHPHQPVVVVQHVLLLLQGLLQNYRVEQVLGELEVVDLQLLALGEMQKLRLIYNFLL